MTPLPRYTRRTPSFAYIQNSSSPAPTYKASPIPHPPHTEPQEVFGTGLTEDEFNRRTKSRSPANHSVDGPIELATQRFSANNPDAEARSPLLETKQKPKPKLRPNRDETSERHSRLRSRPAMVDLRAEASRSPSRGPARSFDSNDW